MALFTKTTKTRVSGMKGNISIKKFYTAVGATNGREKAITLKLLGTDMRTYQITLYGREVEQLEYVINKSKFEE